MEKKFSPEIEAVREKIRSGSFNEIFRADYGIRDKCQDYPDVSSSHISDLRDVVCMELIRRAIVEYWPHLVRAVGFELGLKNVAIRMHFTFGFLANYEFEQGFSDMYQEILWGTPEKFHKFLQKLSRNIMEKMVLDYKYIE